MSFQRRFEAVGTPSRVPEWVWKRVLFQPTRNGESPTTKRAATVSWNHQLVTVGRFKGGPELGKAGSEGQIPLKFGFEVRNCIWCLCQAGVKVTEMTPPPYIALAISKIRRGGVKINVSCYTIKLNWFLTLTPLLKMVSVRLGGLVL